MRLVLSFDCSRACYHQPLPRIALYLLLLVSSKYLFTNSIEVKCNYKNYGWHAIGAQRYCDVKSLQVTERVEVTKIIGQHDDVPVVNIASLTCFYLPSGFEKLFTNIRALQVHNSGLREIKKQDLDVFPNLAELWMRNNKLTYLDGDLFDGNLLIEWIRFENNQLKHIGRNFLTSSSNLRHANFNANKCISKAIDNRNLVEELKRDLILNCERSADMLERDILKIVSFSNINAAQSENVNDKEVTELKVDIVALKDTINQLKQELSDMAYLKKASMKQAVEIEALQGSNEILKTRVKKLETQVENTQQIIATLDDQTDS